MADIKEVLAGVPLPEPVDYRYEWDGHRPTDSIQIFTEAQMHAFGEACARAAINALGDADSSKTSGDAAARPGPLSPSDPSPSVSASGSVPIAAGEVREAYEAWRAADEYIERTLFAAYREGARWALELVQAALPGLRKQSHDGIFMIPVQLPDGRIVKMRKCDIHGDDLMAFCDFENLPPQVPREQAFNGAESNNPCQGG